MVALASTISVWVTIEVLIARNQINFSYGSSYIYQQQHISTLLPSSTGLQVNGYNFGFTAKNGNGWDDGRVDQLTALVRFWDNTGGRGANNLLYGDVYDLTRKYNWTTFDYSKTFTTPLAVPSIGQVQYGFIGSDKIADFFGWRENCFGVFDIIQSNILFGIFDGFLVIIN